MLSAERIESAAKHLRDAAVLQAVGALLPSFALLMVVKDTSNIGISLDVTTLTSSLHGGEVGILGLCLTGLIGGVALAVLLWRGREAAMRPPVTPPDTPPPQKYVK